MLTVLKAVKTVSFLALEAIDCAFILLKAQFKVQIYWLFLFCQLR